MTPGIVLPSTAEPEVTIVVLGTVAADRLAQCLRAIADAGTDGVAAQVVLCANASDPDVLEVVEAAQGAIVMRSRVNLGTAATWNRAIEAVPSARFAILHEDACVRPGWLGALWAALDDDRTIAIAGARLYEPDGRLQNQGWIQWRDSHPWPVNEASAPTLGLFADVTPVDAVSSATMLVDRAAWSEIGGFDEGSFPAVATDAELCGAARARGRTVVTVPDAHVVHGGSAMVVPNRGWAKSLAFRHFLAHRNHPRFQGRWAALLESHHPVPSGPPGLDAMLAAIDRTRSAAASPRSFPPYPECDRSLTEGARPDLDAPRVVEERARRLFDRRRDEFLDWVSENWGHLQYQYEERLRKGAT